MTSWQDASPHSIWISNCLTETKLEVVVWLRVDASSFMSFKFYRTLKHCLKYETPYPQTDHSQDLWDFDAHWEEHINPSPHSFLLSRFMIPPLSIMISPIFIPVPTLVTTIPWVVCTITSSLVGYEVHFLILLHLKLGLIEVYT